MYVHAQYISCVNQWNFFCCRHFWQPHVAFVELFVQMQSNLDKARAARCLEQLNSNQVSFQGVNGFKPWIHTLETYWMWRQYTNMLDIIAFHLFLESTQRKASCCHPQYQNRTIEFRFTGSIVERTNLLQPETVCSISISSIPLMWFGWFFHFKVTIQLKTTCFSWNFNWFHVMQYSCYVQPKYSLWLTSMQFGLLIKQNSFVWAKIEAILRMVFYELS